MGVQINGDTGNISATKADYSGNVTIGGTLTYEDVTNIDSVGLITARTGIEIGARPGVAASISVDGNMIVSGITTISTVKVGGGVTISESGIEASGIGITCANINGTQIGGRRNLIINGAMQVAQRGTSDTSTNGVGTVDRFGVIRSGVDENPTQAQVDVASGTTPYSLGFRKAFKLTNGNQTGGTGVTDYISMRYKWEAQDIANSGWNYTSSSSFVTLSFWCKSSVALNFYGYFYSHDGTAQSLAFETGSLTADTWTKVVLKIPGNSNLQFDNNNDNGLDMYISQFWGTDRTDSGKSLNTWAAYSGTSRTPDFTNTWYSTNDATFELTGVQLEVGPQATAFEHRSFGEELTLCQRYYFRMNSDDDTNTMFGTGWVNNGNEGLAIIHFPVKLRAAPSALEQSGTSSHYRLNEKDANHNGTSGPTFSTCGTNTATVSLTVSSAPAGRPIFLRSNNASAFLAWSAEL